MMFWVLAVAGSPLTPPQLPKQPIITYQDYPTSDAASGKQGAVIFHVFIDPKGKPLDCVVEQVVETDYSKLVCARVLRARFGPAIDRSGNPVFGLHHSVLSFWIPELRKTSPYPLSLKPDIELLTKPIKGLIETQRDVKLAVLVDGGGKVMDCASDQAADDPRLVDAACEQAAKSWSGQPFQGSYIQAIKVRFAPESAKP